MSLFSCKLYELLNTQGNEITEDKIFIVTNFLHKILKGSYCLIIIIKGYGMIAVRDKYGIRPLIFGKKEDNYIIASESVALNLLDYDIIRDMYMQVKPLFLKNNITIPYHNSYANAVLRPCLFEYIYFARPDSTIDKINVNEARIQIGRILGSKMKEVWDCNEIDYIIPVPDTSVTFANGIQEIIKRPLREGFIKNRYIDRTFIMKNKNIIQQNIRRKIVWNTQ